MPRHVGRRQLIGGLVGGAATASLLGTAPPARADAGRYAIAFKANVNRLWWTASDDHTRAVMPDTSPTIIANGAGGYQLAIQDDTGHLEVYGDHIRVSTGQAMAPRTSPAIARLSDGRYVVAYQGSNGHLHIWDSVHGTTGLGLGMAPGTSPAIAAGPGGNFRMVFQANTGSLWQCDSVSGAADRGQGMAPGTSPAIAWVGGWQMAFQANTGYLFTFGDVDQRDLGLGMAPGTSPAMAQGVGGYRIVFQANTTMLWYWDSQTGPRDYGLGMMPGTSPAVGGLAAGGYQHAFQANTGYLWTVGDGGDLGDLGLGMESGTTSPALAGNPWAQQPPGDPGNPGDPGAPPANPYPPERGAPGTYTRRARFVKEQVEARFPGIKGSTYAASTEDHSTGNAIDCAAGRIGRWPSASEKAAMRSLADWSRQHAVTLKIKYVIYEQKIWSLARDAEGWRQMPDRGSLTANHYDHVHISVQS